MNETVAQQLIGYLEDRGVEYIFGMCGHTNIALLVAMENSSITFVNVRHEQIAAHAADGYARASGKTGVVLTHLGPALTNAVTGVANAALDCIPLVMIAGDVPSHFYGKHPHQEINLHSDGSQCEIFKPFCKRVWRVEKPEHMPEIIDKAFRLAESGQPGPVLVDVPMDIFSREIDPALFARQRHNVHSLRKPTIDENTAEEIVLRMATAEKPLIYVGGGIILAGAAEQLQLFVDHLGIPVAHSLMGKGALPDDHPLTLGMSGFWGTRYINDSCLGADVILGLGSRFKEADSSSWENTYTFDIPKTKLIQIDIEPAEIGRNYPVEMGVVADLKQALTVLNRVARRLYPEGIGKPKLVAEIAAYRREFVASNQAMVESDAFPMMPERILADLRVALPRDAIITTDVGWNKNGVGQQFPCFTPGSILTPGGLATMGFGSPAALGAKLACPDRVVVSLVGDGGFGQNPAVLASAVHERAAVIWIVMNNNAFGTIAGLEKAHFGTTFGAIFERDGVSTSPDYAMLARSYGVEGVRIESADQFLPAVKRAIESGKPTLIDVAMRNNPTPTTGHWNILDIYSPNKNIGHVTTD